MAKIITAHEAAEMLGITHQRVRQLVRELGLSLEKVGNTRIFTAADVRKMAARSVRRGPQKGTKYRKRGAK